MIDIYLDINSGRFTDAAGANINLKPQLVYMEYAEWKIHPIKVEANKSVNHIAVPDEVVSFRAAVDLDRNSETDPLIFVPDTKITLPKEDNRKSILVELPANTTSFRDRVQQTTKIQSAIFELYGFDAEGRQIYRITFDMQAWPAVDPFGTLVDSASAYGLPAALSDLPAGQYALTVPDAPADPRSWTLISSGTGRAYVVPYGGGTQIIPKGYGSVILEVGVQAVTLDLREMQAAMKVDQYVDVVLWNQAPNIARSYKIIYTTGTGSTTVDMRSSFRFLKFAENGAYIIRDLSAKSINGKDTSNGIISLAIADIPGLTEALAAAGGFSIANAPLYDSSKSYKRGDMVTSPVFYGGQGGDALFIATHGMGPNNPPKIGPFDWQFVSWTSSESAPPPAEDLTSTDLGAFMRIRNSECPDNSPRWAELAEVFLNMLPWVDALAPDARVPVVQDGALVLVPASKFGGGGGTGATLPISPADWHHFAYGAYGDVYNGVPRYITAGGRTLMAQTPSAYGLWTLAYPQPGDPPIEVRFVENHGEAYYQYTNENGALYRKSMGSSPQGTYTLIWSGCSSDPGTVIIL